MYSDEQHMRFKSVKRAVRDESSPADLSARVVLEAPLSSRPIREMESINRSLKTWK
jgi:hypothetical protein